eukprot:2268740-Amphidinium_carterae.1
MEGQYIYLPLIYKDTNEIISQPLVSSGSTPSLLPPASSFLASLSASVAQQAIQEPAICLRPLNGCCFHRCFYAASTHLCIQNSTIP